MKSFMIRCGINFFQFSLANDGSANHGELRHSVTPKKRGNNIMSSITSVNAFYNKKMKKFQKNLKRCRDGVPKSKKTRVGIA